tara:strand:+ start:1161 stop:1790 length:630 start_codon:yes stop_codon:yes gene_type:complete
MKSPTEEYQSLKSSLKNTRKILSRVPMHSCDTDPHHLKVRSYIFLTHAAFEQYLEDLAAKMLDTSVELFNKHQKINTCIFSVVVFETIAQFNVDDSRKRIRSDVVKNLSKFVNLANRNHRSVIDSNNGIKKKDQQKLLLPLGLDPEEVDLQTSAHLDAFGVKRGAVAHKAKIVTNDTKSSVLADTKNICDGLKLFDRAACRAVATSMKR